MGAAALAALPGLICGHPTLPFRMTARLHVGLPLRSGEVLSLPPGATRHVQVLRLQPGAALVLFNGQGGEWAASVRRIGRAEVEVEIGAHDAIDRELPVRVTLAFGMPANDRMDDLVEKATELGVATIQPLLCERSVLRLSGDRAEKKRAHWQAVAVAACEQSGRTRVPHLAPVASIGQWLGELGASGVSAGPGNGAPAAVRVVLSVSGGRPLASIAGGAEWVGLSGPEGGLTETEEALARRADFVPVSLGPRVLRANTAPLVLLAHCGIRSDLAR